MAGRRFDHGLNPRALWEVALADGGLILPMLSTSGG
jgi:hypothetical protein